MGCDVQTPSVEIEANGRCCFTSKTGLLIWGVPALQDASVWLLLRVSNGSQKRDQFCAQSIVPIS
jgi:hypothetical protein